VQAAGVEVDDLRWEVPTIGYIRTDAALDDWESVPYKTQSPFRNCDKTGGNLCASPFVQFDVCVACAAGETWLGITDYSEVTALGSILGAIYIAHNVLDDTHQNPAPDGTVMPPRSCSPTPRARPVAPPRLARSARMQA